MQHSSSRGQRVPGRSRAAQRQASVEKEKAFRVTKVKPKTLLVSGATVAPASPPPMKKDVPSSVAKLKPNLNSVKLPEIPAATKVKAETQMRVRVKPERSSKVESMGRVGVIRPIPVPRLAPLYRYSIGPGNNPAIAQAAIQARPWWAPGAPTHFYWRARFEVSYDLFNGGKEKRLINRFEKFYELHEKDNMFRRNDFQKIGNYIQNSQNISETCGICVLGKE